MCWFSWMQGLRRHPRTSFRPGTSGVFAGLRQGHSDTKCFQTVRATCVSPLPRALCFQSRQSSRFARMHTAGTTFWASVLTRSWSTKSSRQVWNISCVFDSISEHVLAVRACAMSCQLCVCECVFFFPVLFFISPRTARVHSTRRFPTSMRTQPRALPIVRRSYF